MYIHIPSIRQILFIGLSVLLFSACGTRAPHYNYPELAQAAIRLNMDISMNDNHPLFIESSRWIGVPYRAGGNDKSGTDCSGLSASIFRNAFGIKLKRTSEQQRTANCRAISKRQLQQGDLVFFHNGRNKRTANHVGVYLKNNRFIHASTSRGVIVSNLNEPYYKRLFMQGGHVKGL